MYIPTEIEKILFSAEQIGERVNALGRELTRDYEGKNPLFLCILKGACVFFADIVRSIDCPLEFGFLRASSYEGTNSSGKVTLDLSAVPDIEGRDVVIVEDIVDTARTLSALKKHLLELNPRSVKVACLLDKPSRRVVEGFSADYTGFVIEDLFVVGYGLDCDQKFRNLPYIGIYKS